MGCFVGRNCFKQEEKFSCEFSKDELSFHPISLSGVILMHWTDPYIGIPFKPKGGTKDGADCWGLVRLVLKEVFGKTLPDYLENPFDQKANAEKIDEQKAIVDARLVQDKEDGRLVFLESNGFVSHIGIVVKDHGVLHTERSSGSVIERWSSLARKYRVEGIYDVN